MPPIDFEMPCPADAAPVLAAPVTIVFSTTACERAEMLNKVSELAVSKETAESFTCTPPITLFPQRRSAPITVSISDPHEEQGSFWTHIA
jgi:hypothetical protein